tara:strand:- start:253 stop:477 length:225 start_codon:yes stop_codon:yes gene_type:complete
MKKILIEYLWIFSVTAALLTVALLLFPDKKNRLEFIEQRMDDVQEQRKVLTEKEKELEKLATEKEWEEIDKENK